MQLKVTHAELSDRDELVVEIICGGKVLTIRKNLSKSEADYIRKATEQSSGRT